MGGGGGGGFFLGTSTPEELLEKVRKSKARTSNQEFEIEVACEIGKLLVEYNDRDVEAVNKHLETIRNTLRKDFDDTIDLKFGGSVAKHTYVDGLSDIDALVLLDKSKLKGMTPQELKEYLHSRLEERLSNTRIKVGDLAITVEFTDAEIQLVPVVRHGSSLQIADAKENRWSSIRPEQFTKLLSKVNEKRGMKVIPTIKLAKSIISDLPENRQLKGYHIEAIAVKVFKQYDGPTTPKAMLTHFFREASNYVLRPMKDRTGQSAYVDDYLKRANSLERKVVADSLSRIGRRMQNADDASSARQWRDILGIS